MAQSRHRRIAILGTALHLGFVACLFVEYLGYVPSAKKTFDEFGVTLPWITLSVIRISNWFVEFWWVTAPFVLLAAGAQFVLLSQVDKHSHRVRLKVAWVVGIALMLGAIAIATWCAMELPMLKLREGLAK